MKKNSKKKKNSITTFAFPKSEGEKTFGVAEKTEPVKVLFTSPHEGAIRKTALRLSKIFDF